MNRRKKLKRLKSDNKLMRMIIDNTEEMARIYAMYNEPMKNVIHATRNVRQFKSRREIPRECLDNKILEEAVKKEVVTSFFDVIRDNMTFEITDGLNPTITGSIWIMEKETEE